MTGRTAIVIGLLVSLVFVAGATRTAFAMDLVSDGEPASVIVLAPDAPSMVQFAAAELQGYIGKISGVKIPIQTDLPASDRAGRILVGESAHTRELGLSLDGLGPDGFRIVAEKNVLALYGKESEPRYGPYHPFRVEQCFDPKTGLNRYGETGALYAVYRFLEDHCGVRWYMPGDLGEVVPKKATVRVENVNYAKTPDFEYRFVYYSDFPLDSEAALWYRRVGFGAPYPVGINHSFGSLFRKYEKTHPEYFALVRGGQRDFGLTNGGMGGYCLSNPDLVSQAVRDLRESFDANPEERLMALMPDDGYFTVCECPECRKRIDKSRGETGQNSDHVWGFVDAVAREVYKTHPDKLIGCCSYERYSLPPTNIEKLSPNVAVMICKRRMDYRDPEEKERVNALMDLWGQKCASIFIWEYYLWPGRFFRQRGMPVFFPRIVAEDLRRHRGTVRGEFVEAESWRWRSYDKEKLNFPGLLHPVFYVQGKLYWDVDWDVAKGLDEYYAAFYGPARAEMKAFWTLGEKIYMRETPGGYTGRNLTRLLSLLDLAVAKTQRDSVERKRVELIRSEYAPSMERIERITAVPEMTVPRVKTPPEIDGVLDDVSWKHAARARFVDMAGEEAEYGTEAYFTCDDSNLYLGFVNEEPETTGMVANVTERDNVSGAPIWDDEVIDIYIDATPDTPSEYHQLIVNTRAALWDCHQVMGDSDFSNPRNWDSNAEARTKVEDGRWVVELSIPFKDLGITELQSAEARANFYRMRVNSNVVVTMGTGITTGWSPTLWPFNYAPERFGVMAFSK